MKVIDSPISDNMWSQLADEFIRPVVIPEGYESISQISAKINRGSTATKLFVKKLMKAGKLDVIVTGQYGTRYYRSKNYAKQNKR